MISSTHFGRGVCRSTLTFFAICLGLGSVSACGEAGPSAVEAMQMKAEEEFAESTEYTPKKRERPEGLPPPTDEEFRAWNRKDPGGEKFLYKWDKANLDKMVNYFEEIECFREKIKEEGEKARGAEPGSPEEENWYQFKKMFINHVNGWQQRLFANEPRILEKSKYIGHFLEAHELVMYGYPKAYNENDETALEKADAHWMIVMSKIKKYSKQLGGEWPERDYEANEKAMKRHAKVCEEAMSPPDRSGKEKKVRRSKKKSPI
jgi:hypothetical protein